MSNRICRHFFRTKQQCCGVAAGCGAPERCAELEKVASAATSNLYALIHIRLWRDSSDPIRRHVVSYNYNNNTTFIKRHNAVKQLQRRWTSLSDTLTLLNSMTWYFLFKRISLTFYPHTYTSFYFLAFPADGLPIAEPASALSVRPADISGPGLITRRPNRDK